jgi:hypothetical protein
MVAVRSHLRFACLLAVAGVMLLGGMLLAGPASAHFVRPFVRAVSGTPTGEGGAEVPFFSGISEGRALGGGPEAVAADGEGHLWVMERQVGVREREREGRQEGGKPSEEGVLDEFGPTGASYVRAVTLKGPSEGSFAVNSSSSTDTFDAVGNDEVVIFNESGEVVKKFAIGSDPAKGIARDGSTDPLDPSAGDFYVFSSVHEDLAREAKQVAIRKFDSAGEEANFEGCGGCSGVSGNEIVLPAKYGNEESYQRYALAVDPVNDDIYIAVEQGVSGSGTGRGVLEFEPSGRLVREINGEEAPGFPQPESAAFSSIEGLAVDPSNGDLLVTQQGEATGKQYGVVDEFDSEGVFLGQITETATEPLLGAFGVAVDGEGDAYVIDHAYDQASGTHAVDVYGAGHFVPVFRPAAASERTGVSAVLRGFVNPESEVNEAEHAGLSDCRFEYVSETAYQKSGFEDLSSGGQVPCEAPDAVEVPKDDSYTAVHARVGEHVEAGVTYRYRLSATVAGALGGVAHGVVQAFTAPHAPRVGATAASEVTSTFARLSADVDPLGADTTYRFQYLTEAQFKANGESFSGPAAPVSAPASPVDVGGGGEAGDLTEAVSQDVGGLTPETTYRFRVVASNDVGVSEGEVGEGDVEVARVFTTQPAAAAGLPDGRAYELLTPPDKEGTQDMFGESFGLAEEDDYQGRRVGIEGGSKDMGVSSESGDAFLLETLAAFGGYPASGHNAYVFSRHPVKGDPGRAEWSFSPLTSPGLGLQNLYTAAIEPFGFSAVAVNDRVGAYASEAGEARTSLLGPAGGPYTTVHADQGTHLSDAGNGLQYPQETTEVVGASRDLGAVVLRSNNPRLAEGGLCEGEVIAGEGVLEHDACSPAFPHLYEWSGGQLKMVDVQSNGEPVGSCGAELGGGLFFQAHESGVANGAVSADGSKVFFTAPIPDYGLGMKGCAAIENPNQPNERVENPPQLYMRSGEETVPVSAPKEAGAPESTARFAAYYAGAAVDGSRVFFSSEGELTANDAGIHDMELYEYDTETERVTRISAGESGHAAAGVIFGEGSTLLGYKLESSNTSKAFAISSDGSRVYFIATGVLVDHPDAEGRLPEAGQPNVYVYDTQTGRTAFVARGLVVHWDGFDTLGIFPEVGEATPDGRFLLFRSEVAVRPGSGTGELYRYDAETESVLCVSCTPGGPSAAYMVPPSTPINEWQTLPAHSISNDGSYVFFNTAQSLVPQAANGVLDVYEWHEGHGVSLIGSGSDSLPTYLLGASADGHDVFIGTHARLVAADTDNLGDVYDARICTAAEPCVQSGLAREGLCEGDACSHPVAAPSDATPASATFSGAGDLTPASSTTPKAKRCVKPKKLSGGRCVKVKSKRRKAKAKGKKASATRARAGRARSGRGGGRS